MTEPSVVRRRVLAQGRYLTLVDEQGWEYVVREGVTGVAVIVAVTDADELLLVEQPRVSVHRRCIELPAGLVGDGAGHAGETIEAAARRELLEETGYNARVVEPLADGPISVGVSSETVTFFRARGLDRVGPGGGDDSEDITVHAVALAGLPAFLRGRRAAGLAIDPKIYAGLFLIDARVPR